MQVALQGGATLEVSIRVHAKGSVVVEFLARDASLKPEVERELDSLRAGLGARNLVLGGVQFHVTQAEAPSGAQMKMDLGRGSSQERDAGSPGPGSPSGEPPLGKARKFPFSTLPPRNANGSLSISA